jgi:hypothetical protein
VTALPPTDDLGLRVPLAAAIRELAARVDAGEELLARVVQSTDELQSFRLAAQRWQDDAHGLLATLFVERSFAIATWEDIPLLGSSGGSSAPEPAEEADELRADLARHVDAVKVALTRLRLAESPTTSLGDEPYTPTDGISPLLRDVTVTVQSPGAGVGRPRLHA